MDQSPILTPTSTGRSTKKLGYRLVVHKDGTLELTFGAEGEAHLPPDYGKRKPPPPDDPAWDNWRPGDLLPKPTPGYDGTIRAGKELQNGSDDRVELYGPPRR